MTKYKAARSSSHYHAPYSSTLVKSRTPKSIAQLDSDRARRDNFDKGCRWAAILLCGMFAVLSLGSWWFGW